MNRATFTIVVEYDGELNVAALEDRFVAALDSYVGHNYPKVQYQNHTIEIEEQDAD